MGGNVYELDHLHPLLWEVTIPAKAQNAERVLKIVVSYSMHCFTRKPSTDEDVAADAWYSDSREKRVFDSGRWALSKRLPSIIGADLNLFINSAHERIDALKYKKPIRFFIILLNRLLGKPIREAP